MDFEDTTVINKDYLVLEEIFSSFPFWLTETKVNFFLYSKKQQFPHRAVALIAKEF